VEKSSLLQVDLVTRGGIQVKAGAARTNLEREGRSEPGVQQAAKTTYLHCPDCGCGPSPQRA